MTISRTQIELIGARVYAPEGPFGVAGQQPLPSFSPGEVAAGDYGAEFIYLLFPVATAGLTVNQGDWLAWDNSGAAILTPAAAAGSLPFGANVGPIYLGGRIGGPSAAPGQGNIWSYTFPVAGVYGVWAQRAGVGLGNLATVNAQTKALGTTATVGQLSQPATALANSMGVTGAWSAPTTNVFTATTVTGSTVLSAVSSCKGLAIGQNVSGTGIATGSVITDIQGSTVTLSLAATASGSGVSITAANMSTYATTTNGSTSLTNVTSIAGLYPNQTISGTGIPGSTKIVSISGNAAPWTIVMSAAASATANNIAVTATGYYEMLLDWPYVASQN